MTAWLFIKGLTRFIPAKAAMYAALAAVGAAVVAWLRRDAVKDDRAKHEIADLKGEILANELEQEAQDNAENKTDAELIASNTRGGSDNSL